MADPKTQGLINAVVRMLELMAFYKAISEMFESGIAAVKKGKAPEAFWEESTPKLQRSIAHVGGTIGSLLVPSVVNEFVEDAQGNVQQFVEHKYSSKEDKPAAQKLLAALPNFLKGFFGKTFGNRTAALVTDSNGIMTAHMHDPRCTTWDEMFSHPSIGMQVAIVKLLDVPSNVSFGKCCRFSVDLPTGTTPVDQQIMERLHRDHEDEVRTKRFRRLTENKPSENLIYPTTITLWNRLWPWSFKPTTSTPIATTPAPTSTR